MALGIKKSKNLDEDTSREKLKKNLNDALNKAIDEDSGRDGEIDDGEADKVKRPKSIEQRPALHTGEDSLKGDKVSYATIQEILKNAIHPPDWRGKFRLYMPYIVIFTIMMALFAAAFWQVLVVRGTPNWTMGVVVMLFPMFFLYFYIIEIKERKDTLYPKWCDVNSGFVFRYQKLGEVEGYMYITPFAVFKQRVYQPRNSYGDGSMIKIAIDKHCIYENNEGIVTTGILHFDLTGRSTFRVEQDQDFVPNPAIHRLLFQLSISNTKLTTEREIQYELRKKLETIRKLIVEEEIDYVTKIVRKFIPVMTMMIKSKEMDLVSDVAWAEAMSRQGLDPKKYKTADDKRMMEAIRQEMISQGD
jgi:hypothetical protein